MNCQSDLDCISLNCGQDRKCNPGSDKLSCAWLKEKCSLDTECCSGQCRQNQCVGKSRQCGNYCGEFVGKVCAGNGEKVQFGNECCSSRMLNGYCVRDQSNSLIYCESDEKCPSGLKCHDREKICTVD